MPSLIFPVAILCALVVLVSLAVLLLSKRRPTPEPTNEELLRRVFGCECIKTESGTGGDYHTQPIPFQLLKDEKGLPPATKELLQSRFGDDFTVTFSGYVDPGLLHEPTLSATIRNDSGEVVVKLA